MAILDAVINISKTKSVKFVFCIHAPKVIFTAWSTLRESVKINANGRCTPLLQDVMAHTSVTSHCFWLTSRHAVCNTRPVRKVTRGQVMSGHIITIISVQHFLKNGNTFGRPMIKLSLNKLCLVMTNQVCHHYHAWMPWFSRVFYFFVFHFCFLSLSFFLFHSTPTSIYMRLLTDTFIYLW